MPGLPYVELPVSEIKKHIIEALMSEGYFIRTDSPHIVDVVVPDRQITAGEIANRIAAHSDGVRLVDERLDIQVRPLEHGFLPVRVVIGEL